MQVIGAKGDTFGLSDGASIINGITKGAPIKAVMGIMNTTPFAIIAREDANIKTLKDLEGKTIAATAGEAGLTIMPALIKANKLDEAKLNFLRVDGATKLVATLEKKADAMLGGSENQAVHPRAEGPEDDGAQLCRLRRQHDGPRDPRPSGHVEGQAEAGRRLHPRDAEGVRGCREGSRLRRSRRASR